MGGESKKRIFEMNPGGGRSPPLLFESPMSGKHKNWHKGWTRLPNGRLRHISGVEFTVESGEGFTDINAADDTLAEFQVFELARGVPVHDLAQRLMRLAREAGEWLQTNP
jgi:hypothetical protein